MKKHLIIIEQYFNDFFVFYSELSEDVILDKYNKNVPKEERSKTSFIHYVTNELNAEYLDFDYIYVTEEGEPC